MALGLATALSLGANVLGSVLSSKKASNAAGQAAALPMNNYNQSRNDLMPFMSTGTSALGQLSNLFGLGGANGGLPNGAAMTSALESFPGYQFGRDQGVKAMDNSGSAKGMMLSGAQMQGLNQFGQQYGMQQAWQPYVSMLMQLSQLGAQTGTSVGQMGQTAAQTAISPTLQQGQAKGNGIAGLFGGIGQLAGLLGAGGAPGASGVGVNPADMMNTGDMGAFQGLY